MTFFEGLVGGGCCCVTNETAQVIDVNGTSEADGAAFESVEAASPFLTVKMARVKGLPIGLDVDMLDGVSLVVDRIKEGFVKSWNEENPGMAIQVHDRIIEVNGTRFNAQALAAELHHATEWDMRISRPQYVSVSVEHEPKAAFGVDLRPWRGQLLIAKIGEGFLQDWLVRNPRARLHQYDRIMQINGVRGSSHKLLRVLHHASEASTTLTLDVLHYHTLPEHFGNFVVLGREQTSGGEKTVELDLAQKGGGKTVEADDVILDIMASPEKKPSAPATGGPHACAPPSCQDFALFPDQERGERAEV